MQASANDVTHRKRTEDFENLKIKSVSWVETCLGRRRLTFVCSQRPWAGVARDGGRWKSQNRKNVYLSFCRRTFKLKGNKKFRTWTKKSLRVFRISRFLGSLHICYEHYERFTYRYEYVHFAYPYLAMLHDSWTSDLKRFWPNNILSETSWLEKKRQWWKYLNSIKCTKGF